MGLLVVVFGNDLIARTFYIVENNFFFLPDTSFFNLVKYFCVTYSKGV